jgi:hypothetical protein
MFATAVTLVLPLQERVLGSRQLQVQIVQFLPNRYYIKLIAAYGWVPAPYDLVYLPADRRAHNHSCVDRCPCGNFRMRQSPHIHFWKRAW